MKNITILISGAGSNMKAIVGACEDDILDAEVTTVIYSKKYGYEEIKDWCQTYGIKCYQVVKSMFQDEWQYYSKVGAIIAMSKPDLVVLAGYMHVHPERIVSQYEGRMINIHPSLLPKYPGLHTHGRALNAWDTKTGATVHYVIPELDAGPIIKQEEVCIYIGDTVEEIEQRVRAIEHGLYISAIEEILYEGIDMHHRRCCNAHKKTKNIPETLETLRQL